MTSEEIIQDALQKINNGHYNNACGQLRLLLEKYLKKLCAENPGVHPRSDSNSDMIYELSHKIVIDNITKSKFLSWKNLGNAGAHIDSPTVEKIDAEHFLHGIAQLLEININPNSNPEIQKEIESKCANKNLPPNYVNTGIDKKTAIKIISNNTEHVLNNSNCSFSNVNKSKPVWWLDPACNKFRDDFFIVLNDNIKNILYLFKIPAETINAPTEKFRPKNENQVSIEIRTDNIDEFTDTKSGGTNFKFKEFLIDEICY